MKKEIVITKAIEITIYSFLFAVAASLVYRMATGI